LLVVAAVLTACGARDPLVTARLASRTPIALNEAIVVVLDGAVDPMRVTDLSVQVRDPGGRVLPARVTARSGRMVLELLVDEGLFQAAPTKVGVTLAGLPSAHALSTIDGRWLGATTHLVVEVDPSRLRSLGASSVRVVSVAGHGVPPPSPLRNPEPLTLVFDGVLDPLTLGPGSFSLFPVEQGLVLGEPLDPIVRWRCVGRRFEVELDLGGARGRFELDLRTSRMRDLAGAVPEPALKIELALS
jgi:hypothetical protein